MSVRNTLFCLCAGFPFAVANAAAEEAAATGPGAIASALAKEGAFSPFLLPAAETGRGYAVAATSYNTVTDEATVDVSGNVHLTGRFSLVLRVDNAVSDAARPGIGGAVRLLDERRHGVAATGYLLYKAEGFAEPEGELEALASFGRSFGRVRGTANFAYGQDPEGNERDGEASIGVQIEPVERVSAGVLGRYRDALGSRGEAGVVRDVFAGALATATIGRVGVTGLFGVSGIETKTSGAIETGVSGVVAVGAAF